PFRRELLAHCYRMLGSLHDAEDAVQDTYLRAWRAYDRFEGRSSLRNWLYRIATNACLRALERSGRRPLPSGLGAPSADPERPLELGPPGLDWLEPLPDARLGSGPDDPAALVASRDSVRLAFVAALQHLPARQRAVLILRDVLEWRAAEVAELLGTSAAAVNSALQRARAQLAEVAPAEDELAPPDEPDRRALLDRYVAAFEDADVAALERLLRADVELEMPPFAAWFSGREMVRRFFAAQILVEPGRFRMVLTAANGQPAVLSYLRDRDGVYRPHAVHVLTLTPGGIARIVVFLDPASVAAFDPPLSYDSA
ncbi:MAG TPA: sigma-70 family RNA polymerase sigma factor, partial [Candidatus Dormibacteraeota bacterium]